MSLTSVAPQNDKPSFLARIGHYGEEVANFLFATDSIKKLVTGKGNWGDLANVGITAATFFIPPLKLFKLAPEAVKAVMIEGERILSNEVISETAKQKVIQTIGNSKAFLEATPEQRILMHNEAVTQEAKRMQLSSEYNPAITTAEDMRTIEPNITLGPGATASDLAEYKTLQGPDKLMERNPDLKSKDVSILTNKNDIPSADKSGKVVANSERAADAKIKRDLNRGTPEEIKIAQRIDELNIKTPREAKARSAIGAQLHEVILDKNTLEEMLTLSGKEIGRDQVGKVVGTLRSLAQKEKDPEVRRQIYKDIEDLKKNGMSANIVDRIKLEVKKLNEKTDELKGYIEDPTSSAAKRQSEETIPFFKTDKKTGITTRDWKSPRSYEGSRPSSKLSRSPELPARSSKTELKSDEKNIIKQLKVAKPEERKALLADLKRTRDQINKEEFRFAREYSIKQAKDVPTASKPVEQLSLKELESEISRLRNEWNRIEKFTGKQADKMRKEIGSRGEAVRDLLDKARIKSEQIKKPEKAFKSKEEQASEYWKQDGELQSSRKDNGFNSADQGYPTDVNYNSEVDALLPITSFRGEAAFLSNMSSSPIKLGGVEYPTVEHAFQAAKTIDPVERAKILAAKTAGEAKKIGRNVTLRKNWNQIREEVMEKALRAKFEQNPELLDKLLKTGDTHLIEGNNWGDKFWGKVNGEGENRLGELLMKIRNDMSKSSTSAVTKDIEETPFSQLKNELGSEGKFAMRHNLFMLDAGRIPYEAVKDMNLPESIKKIVKVVGESKLIDGRMIEYLNKEAPRPREFLDDIESVVTTSTKEHISSPKLLEEKVKKLFDKYEQILTDDIQKIGKSEYENSKHWYPEKPEDFHKSQQMEAEDLIHETLNNFKEQRSKIYQLIKDLVKIHVEKGN